jgi:Zn ribbon nucleic-acid-binding protein
MTRLARYEIYECPKCQSKYRHPIWASISIHMPLSANKSLPRKCIDCGYEAKLNNWIFDKELELLTQEEANEKIENLMRNLVLNYNQKKESYLKKIANYFKNTEKHQKEYQLYRDIEIVGDVK